MAGFIFSQIQCCSHSEESYNRADRIRARDFTQSDDYSLDGHQQSEFQNNKLHRAALSNSIPILAQSSTGQNRSINLAQ